MFFFVLDRIPIAIPTNDKTTRGFQETCSGSSFEDQKIVAIAREAY